MMYDKAQCKILFQIIRVSLFDSDEFEINAEADWKLIYRISREHKIHTILCRGLEKISSKDKIPEKMIGKLEELWQIERAKDAVQKYSIDEILDAFEKDKIDCVPLKGIYMKEFYPDSSLRTMSDLDIFYRQGDEEKIEKVLVSKGYVFDHDGPHHDVYQRKPFMNVEMHHHLTDGDPVAEKYYKDVWTTKVHLKKGYTSIYEFSWEDYYIYMLVHLAKHIKLGGSGIRSIIDIKIFLDKKKEELNWDYVKEELKKLHLSQFEYWMRQLSEVWFGTEKTTPLYDELTEFIVDSGTYGTIKNYHASHVVELGGKNQNLSVGKIRSKLEIIFLPYEGMQEQYLYLEKFPFLLPVAWIQRIFRTIVWRKDKITSTLQSTNIEQDRLDNTEKTTEEEPKKKSRLTLGGYGEAVYTRNFYSDNMYRYSKADSYKDSDGHGRVDLPHVVIMIGYDFGKGWSMGSEIEFEHGGTESAIEVEDEEAGEFEKEIERERHSP